MYEVDFTKRPQTEPVIKANKIFRKACYDFAIADVGNILGFNLISNDVMEICKEEKETNNGIKVSFETAQSGLAYFIENDNHATFASTADDKMTFSGISKINKVEKGYYSLTGLWHSEGKVTINNNQINLEKGVTYRMEFTK